MSDNPRRWIVVGGGRWGRTLAMTLLRELPLNCRVGIATHYNGPEVERWLSQLPAHQLKRVGIVEDFDSALVDPSTLAVLVANRPAMHFDTARRILAAGKHAFVEKPFTLDLYEARELVQQSESGNLRLVIGLEYLFATYLHSLRKVIGSSPIRRIGLDWFDPVVEFRHGGEKRADRHTSILHDILPHVWSVLRILVSMPARPRAVAVRGSMVELAIAIADTEAVIRMDRYAQRRLRRVNLDLADRRNVQLDFTTEPGRPVLDGVAQEQCADWKQAPSPVAAELRAFNHAIMTGIKPVHAASLCIDSVRLAVEAQLMTSGDGRAVQRSIVSP